MSKISIIIVGAGKAAELMSHEITQNTDSMYNIVGFVDDAESEKVIDGKKVLGDFASLREIIKNNSVDELLISVPSVRGQVVRTIITDTADLDLKYKILPNISEVLMQDFDKGYLRYVRAVQPEDLLGGEISKRSQEGIREYAKPQTVMITGAAGSIGSELSRQIASLEAERVILYDWWENGIFHLASQLNELYPNGNIEFVIGDVKDVRRLDKVMNKYRPTTVFHAAAYKHVPLMEMNPSEAVKNNILGTKTVAEVAMKYEVDKFVLVSTDKAVNPTNVMGATKRAAEKVLHILADGKSKTKFCSVRFGNVINSNGSAIPFFENQIAKGGPVTVTHKDVTRFFMTIPEAVHLILQAWKMGENNDLFVLEMGESIKILQLAEWLITLNGYRRDEIGVKIIGLRPGEKLYEEVLVGEESTQATAIDKIHKTTNYMNFDKVNFLTCLDILAESIEANTDEKEYVKTMLQKMISTYKPQTES